MICWFWWHRMAISIQHHPLQFWIPVERDWTVLVEEIMRIKVHSYLSYFPCTHLCTSRHSNVTGIKASNAPLVLVRTSLVTLPICKLLRIHPNIRSISLTSLAHARSRHAAQRFRGSPQSPYKMGACKSKARKIRKRGQSCVPFALLLW